jgi:hypothetical protein
MAPTATATITLDGWPPPTIEINALVAAIHDAGADSKGEPPRAFQHLNEVALTFHFATHARVDDDVRAHLIAERALASVYDGPFEVIGVRLKP